MSTASKGIRAPGCIGVGEPLILRHPKDTPDMTPNNAKKGCNHWKHVPGCQMIILSPPPCPHNVLLTSQSRDAGSL